MKLEITEKYKELKNSNKTYSNGKIIISLTVQNKSKKRILHR